MGQDLFRSREMVDEEDTGEVPRDVLKTVLLRIRAEEELRLRAARALKAQAEADVQAYELDASLDSAPRSPQRLWAPVPFFAGLSLAATVPALVIWWMLA